MAIALVAGSAALVPPVAAAPPDAAQRKVGITLVTDFDKKAPRANAAVFFAYYDPKKKEWQRSSQRTDAKGRCAFAVPRAAEGESYVFLYTTAQDEMRKAIQEANDSKRFVWRIPAAEQEELELLIDAKGASKNVKGTIQIWQVPK